MAPMKLPGARAVRRASLAACSSACATLRMSTATRRSTARCDRGDHRAVPDPARFSAANPARARADRARIPAPGSRRTVARSGSVWVVFIRRGLTLISRRGFFRFVRTLGISGLGVAAYGFGFENFRRPKISEYTVRPKHWPAGLSLKVAVIADIHACDPWMTASRVRSIVETT